MEFKLGELFCGPGGIGLGAKLASVKKCKIKHAWASDYDKDTCETYSFNILDGKKKNIICKDIRKLDTKKLKPIDSFAFGFPCNDFSVVGKQKGIDGIFGPLYSYGVNILKEKQPKFFLAENVGGLRSSNDGEAFNVIIKEFKNAGYKVTPHLYKFEEYGVPQARHRIIIIGIRKDLNITFKVPAPTHLNNPVTCKEAIEKPPIDKAAFNHVFTKQSKVVIERLKYIKPGENAFTAELPDHLKLNIKGAKISQIYKRLDPSKPSYTVTGSGGGGTHVYHWQENRALTNRERARLQTFPDDFIFQGSKESIRRQIGMAVPPLAAKVVFEAIFKCFQDIEYENIPANINLKPII